MSWFLGAYNLQDKRNPTELKYSVKYAKSHKRDSKCWRERENFTFKPVGVVQFRFFKI